MRKNFIDNIRWIIILLLFLFHTVMIYNGMGVDYYILQEPSLPITVFLSFFSMWAMPVLFLLAGCSARYSLQKRTLGQYVTERFTKLLLPLAAGVVLILPPMAYFGERFLYGFSGSVWDEYALFFTGTGKTAFDNGANIFIFSHLWFIFFLFIISMITLPFVALFVKKKFCFKLDKAPVWAVVAFGGAAYVAMDVFCPGAVDKNLVDMAFAFLLGFYSFSRDDVQAWLCRLRWLFTAMAAAVFITGWVQLWTVPFVSAIYSWLAMMMAIGWGVRLLNATSRACRYFATASYGIYFFHMPWVVIISYYLITNGATPMVHIAVTIPASFIATIGTYELVRRIPGLRYVFALKKPKKSEKS